MNSAFALIFGGLTTFSFLCLASWFTTGRDDVIHEIRYLGYKVFLVAIGLGVLVYWYPAAIWHGFVWMITPSA